MSDGLTFQELLRRVRRMRQERVNAPGIKRLLSRETPAVPDTHRLRQGARLECGVVDLSNERLLPDGLEVVRLGEDGDAVRQGGLGHLGEDPPLQVVGDEEVASALQRFGLADHQEAAAVEREVEVREDPSLHFGAEVHERVSRHQ